MCGSLVYQGGGYCDAHKADRMQAKRVYDQTTRTDNPALAWAKQVRDSGQWKKLRTAHNAAYPCCCDPFKRHGEFPPLSKVKNHIVSLRICCETGRQHLAFEWGNLASLCTSCDADIGAMERRGEDVTPLFAHCNQ